MTWRSMSHEVQLRCVRSNVSRQRSLPPMWAADLMALKDRSYTVTVNLAHAVETGPPAVAVGSTGEDVVVPTLSNREGVSRWLVTCGELLERGVLDYAVVSLEESKTLRPHLQGFLVFNESVDFRSSKPTDFLPGHWLKARNLSGSRDYCAAVGIHIKKPGVYAVLEYGEWVDPGWNQNLRSRLIYQLAAELEAGCSIRDLCMQYPAAVLLVGTHNIEKVGEFCGNAASPRPRSLVTAPYCYIGRTELASSLVRDEKFSVFLQACDDWRESEEE